MSGAMKPIGEVMAGMGNPAPRGSADMDAGGVLTKHGWFAWEDIGGAEGKFDYDANGERVLRFPVAYSAGGGAPIYRALPEHVTDQHNAASARRHGGDEHE